MRELRPMHWLKPIVIRSLCAVVLAGGLRLDVAAARPLAAQDLVQLDRVSNPQISPNGTWIAYEVSGVDLVANRRTTAIFVTPSDGLGAPTRLTDGSNPQWDPDGQHIFYLGAANGLQQVFRRDTCRSGCGVAQIQTVTHLPLNVESFRLSPTGSRLVVSMAILPGFESPLSTRTHLDDQAKTRADGALYDKLFVRHWDAWADGRRNRLFSMRLSADGQALDPVPLTAGFDGDVPSKPFGGDQDYRIDPKGEQVVFAARQAGDDEALSTNFDLYAAALDGDRAPQNLTSDNKAWDAGAEFSPDGRQMAYRAMTRPGFESDRFRIMLKERATGREREVDPAWDRSAQKIAWSGDGLSLYVLASDVQRNRLFLVTLADGAVHPLTVDGSISDFDVARTPKGDVIALTREAINSPPEIYVLRPGARPVQITRTNEHALKDVTFSGYEPFSFPGWNGETVHGWVVKPSGYKAGRRYPAVFLIHGGPQGSWEDSWSTRWNPEVWAGWGYAVVMVDFHGSTGYGQAFTDAISGHWGDRPLEDLQKGWAAALQRYSFIDPTRACAAGASYGGYMTYWIAGVWNRPWACLIDHDGVFDTRLMGYEIDELWFARWENGHAFPWEKPGIYEAYNPLNHVADWSKPILVIHSAKDFRIPLDQGLAAFTAAQQKGLPSEFLTFPDEGHWVLKPQNALQWHDVVHAWLMRWIGSGPTSDLPQAASCSKPLAPTACNASPERRGQITEVQR